MTRRTITTTTVTTMAIEKNDKLNIASDTIYHNTASFSK